jgi:metallophosphoesterase superfamily enzyme
LQKINTLQIEIAGNTWTLLPQKAVWIDFCKTLLISDVHLGKIEHFRKNGLALPPAAAGKSLETLFALQALYQPDRIIFLGDLFHSKLNNSYLDMRRFRDQTAQVEILLIEGNHDILHPELYRQLDILLLPELKEMPFHARALSG